MRQSTFPLLQNVLVQSTLIVAFTEKDLYLTIFLSNTTKYKQDKKNRTNFDLKTDSLSEKYSTYFNKVQNLHFSIY